MRENMRIILGKRNAKIERNEKITMVCKEKIEQENKQRRVNEGTKRERGMKIGRNQGQ